MATLFASLLILLGGWGVSPAQKPKKGSEGIAAPVPAQILSGRKVFVSNG